MSEAQNTTQIPADLLADLQERAKAAGVSLAAYLRLLMEQQSGHLDHAAADAAAFMLRTQSASLRKLAE